MNHYQHDQQYEDDNGEHQHYQHQHDDEEEDDDDNDVRQQIARFPAHQSFDVSSFAESRNGIQHYPRVNRNNFPISNAPTLEVSPEPKLNFLPTPSQPAPTHKLAHKNSLAEEVDRLRRDVQEREAREDAYIAKIKELNEVNLELEEFIRQKDAIIREKEELLLLQDKRKEPATAKASSVSTSNDNYLQEFCPEFLSPEESLQLFTQLLTKLQKSSTMKKRMLKDRKIIGILGQFFKSPL